MTQKEEIINWIDQLQERLNTVKAVTVKQLQTKTTLFQEVDKARQWVEDMKQYDDETHGIVTFTVGHLEYLVACLEEEACYTQVTENLHREWGEGF